MSIRQPAGLRAPSGADYVLDSWKEISRYLNRDIRTIQRWEQTKGLPVHRLPGGEKPGVYALKSEVDAWRLRERDVHSVPSAGQRPAAKSPAMCSIAVLPFANLSAEKENEHFSDGLADEILMELTRVRNLRVAARTSSFAFRDKQLDVREIGSRLGVDTVLEGSVQRSGGRVRVFAQLVNVSDGFYLWSENYDRGLGEVFAIQDEISRAIAGALEVRLAPSPSRRSVSLDAYNLWLKGRYFQQYENLESLGKCKGYLERAIAIDPLFARPYVAMAELYRSMANFGTVRPRDALALGRQAIGRALELDDSLGEAYALSGAYRAWGDFDWNGAAADFDRALELTPASAEAHTLRAVTYLVPTGRLDEAEREMDRAVESDPVSPLAYIKLGTVLLWARQFDRAQARLETAFELRPDYALAVWYRGVGHYFQGRIEEALTFWEPAMRKIGVNSTMLGAIGMALGFVGRHREARAILADLEAGERESYVSQLSRAQIYMGLGERDAAFEWLDRAVEQRDLHILDMPCKPIWDGLRGDPRFTALLRKMRLA